MNASEKSLKDKVKEIRQCVPVVSNDDIVLVLEYYNGDVTNTIQAFILDGAKEALEQWKFSGQKVPATKSKKKKKKSNRLPEIEEIVIASQSILEVQKMHDSNYSTTETTISSQKHLNSINSEKQESGESSIVKEKVKPKEDYKNKSKKERVRTMSEISTVSQGASKPLLGIEKSTKELEKQMASFNHLRSLFNDGLEKSHKRLHQVFSELRTQMNDKEALVMFELDKIKQEGGKLLMGYENRAVQLKQLTNRAANMSDIELANLRAQIKTYAGVKKGYEEMVSSPRLNIDITAMLKLIQSFVEVPKLKITENTENNLLIEKCEADVNVSDIQSTEMTPLNMTTFTTVVQPIVSTSTHIIHQSDSLTRYELEANALRLANLTQNEDVKVKPTTNLTAKRGSGGQVNRGRGGNRGNHDYANSYRGRGSRKNFDEHNSRPQRPQKNVTEGEQYSGSQSTSIIQEDQAARGSRGGRRSRGRGRENSGRIYDKRSTTQLESGANFDKIKEDSDSVKKENDDRSDKKNGQNAVRDGKENNGQRLNKNNGRSLSSKSNLAANDTDGDNKLGTTFGVSEAYKEINVADKLDTLTNLSENKEYGNEITKSKLHSNVTEVQHPVNVLKDEINMPDNANNHNHVYDRHDINKDTNSFDLERKEVVLTNGVASNVEMMPQRQPRSKNIAIT